MVSHSQMASFSIYNFMGSKGVLNIRCMACWMRHVQPRMPVMSRKTRNFVCYNISEICRNELCIWINIICTFGACMVAPRRDDVPLA